MKSDRKIKLVREKDNMLDLFLLHNEGERPKRWIWVMSETSSYKKEIIDYLKREGRKKVAKNTLYKYLYILNQSKLISIQYRGYPNQQFGSETIYREI